MAISRVPTEDPPRCTALIRDITERKRAEEEIRRLNAELEERVAQRTAQLEATNKELAAFRYSVSHDLRAPLRHIAGYAEILQTEAAPRLDQQYAQKLQTIADSARRLGKLIDALLDFSRTGRVNMSSQTVNLSAVVEEARQELRQEIQNRNIVWQVGPLPTVQGDSLMLRQAVINLISNALKFTNTRPEARIEIASQETDQENIFFVRAAALRE